MFKNVKFWAPSIMESVALILAGLLILVEPAMTSILLSSIVGLMGIMYGIYMIVRWVKFRKVQEESSTDLLLGIALALASLFIYLNPLIVISSLPIIASIGLLFNGISKIPSGIKVRREGGSLLGIVLSIVTPLILGGIMLFYPINSFEILVIMMGSFISIIGFTDLFSILMIRSSLDNLEYVFETPKSSD